jgi:hypothetical protein
MMSKTKKQGQALAIKLSRERRAGKQIPPPPKGEYSEETRKRAIHDLEAGSKKRRAAKKRTAKKR